MSVKDEVKSFVLKNGDKYIIYRGSNIRTYDSLPKGVYRTNVDMFGNIYLTVADDFMIPEKIYGSTRGRAQRILDTFERRDQSTGVLLSGEKGSGKTMLAKHVAMEASAKGYTTIVADGLAVGSPGFVGFMESLVEPCVVLMDEFEKMFENNEHQNHLLSLFDGVSQSKKLYVLTANDPQRINDYFKARPGRLFYNFVYDRLETEVVREVLADNQVPTEFSDKVVEYVEACEKFNFDSLMAIVEEYKRYGFSFEETIEGLNIVQKPTYYWEDSYDVFVHFEGLTKPLTVAVDRKMNLKNGHHLIIDENVYTNMVNHPDNNKDDVNTFIKMLTRGQADSQSSYKTYLKDEGYDDIYLHQKGKVGKKGKQEIYRDISNAERKFLFLTEIKEGDYKSYAGYSW